MSQGNVENRSQIVTLDVLIEQSRSLFEIYDARRSTAEAKKVLASIVLACVVASVLFALLARSAWVCGSSPAHAKELALEMWRARESDSHDTAQAKERGTGVAGLLLGLALVCDGILGYLLIKGAG